MNPSAQTVEMRQSIVQDSAASLERILRLLAHELDQLKQSDAGSVVSSSLRNRCLQSANDLCHAISSAPGHAKNTRLLRTMQESIVVARKATKLLQQQSKGNLLQRMSGVVRRRAAVADAAELATQLLAQLDQQRRILKTIKPSMLEVRHSLPIPILL